MNVYVSRCVVNTPRHLASTQLCTCLHNFQHGTSLMITSQMTQYDTHNTYTRVTSTSTDRDLQAASSSGVELESQSLPEKVNSRTGPPGN